MADTTFTDNSTVIVSAWLNDINDHVYSSTPISPATTVHSASVISNTPAGTIAATTVQAAINELDTEKVTSGGALGTPSSGTLSNCVGLPAAGVTGTAAILGANTFTGQQTFVEVKDTVYTISDGAAFEIDPVNGSVQVVTLGANRTPAATNFEAGQVVILGIDDGTAYSVTWTTVSPTWVKAGGSGTAPTLATTGYTWVLLWKVGSTMYAAEVGKP